MRLFLLCLSGLVCSLASQAQPVTCSVNAGVPPVIRAEGRAELTGDILLICNPTPVGTTVAFDLQVTLTAPVTSRLTGNGFSESLVLIEGLQKMELGVNTFQGKVTSPNIITFQGVKSVSTSASQSHVFRITNVRVDASAVPPSTTLVPTQVFADVSAGAALNISNATTAVAFILNGLSFDIRTADDTGSTVSLSGCPSSNSGLLPGGAGTGVISHQIRFTEGFQNVFKKHSEEPAQNIPGVVFNTESGFFDPGVTPINGLNLAGVATQATRLVASFSGIPAGMNVFVTVNPLFIGSTTLPSAVLVATDANGAGPLTPLPATATAISGGVPVGIRKLDIANGSATAVWEVTNASPAAIDTLRFGVAAAYNTLPEGGRISINGSLAPISNVGVASATEPVPRFRSKTFSPIVSIVACNQQPNLVVESFSVPAREYTKPLDVIALIRNTGTTTAGPFSASVGLYSSQSFSVPVGLPTSCSNPTSLSPGAAFTCHVQLPIASVGPGAYFVGIGADSGNSVQESSEDDNQRFAATSVSQCVTQFGNAALENFFSIGGAASFRVSAPEGCPWTINAPSFIHLERTSGAGSTVVHYTVDPNPSGARTGSVYSGAGSFPVYQSGSETPFGNVSVQVRQLFWRIYNPRCCWNRPPLPASHCGSSMF